MESSTGVEDSLDTLDTVKMTSRRTESTYFDEEDLLGYNIWVAELELLVSQQRQSGASSTTLPKVDFGACYILLQKLHATIDKTMVKEVKEYQRRCEDALIDILLRGCPPPVCFGGLFACFSTFLPFFAFHRITHE